MWMILGSLGGGSLCQALHMVLQRTWLIYLVSGKELREVETPKLEVAWWEQVL